MLEGTPQGRPVGAAATSGTRSASAIPPNVRWSTNRSSGPSSSKSNRACRCFSRRRVGRLDEQLAAHAQVDDQGLPVAVGGLAGPARGTCRGARPQRRRCRSAGRRGRPARGRAGGRPGRRGTAPRAIVRPTTWSCEAAADDLDLGQLRHPRRSGGLGAGGRRSTGRRGRRRRRVGRARSRPPRRPSARPPSCCGRSPSPSTSSPTTARAVKSFSWSGPSSVTRYSGTPSEAEAAQLLQAGLPVEAGAEGGRLRHQRVEQVVHERARPRSMPARQVDGADDAPPSCRRGSRPCRGRRCSPRRGRAGGTRPRPRVRATSARARMLTTAARSLASWPSGRSGCVAVERVGDDEPEHGVAEELEALVVGQAAVLVGVRAVRQGTQQQRLVDRLADHLEEVAGERSRRAAAARCPRRSDGELLTCVGPGQPWCSVRSATA